MWYCFHHFRVITGLIHSLPNIVLLAQYCAGGKIEKNEMGGLCDAYGGGERCAQGSGGET